MINIVIYKIITESWTVLKKKLYTTLGIILLSNSMIISVLYGKGWKITTPKLNDAII